MRMVVFVLTFPALVLAVACGWGAVEVNNLLTSSVTHLTLTVSGYLNIVQTGEVLLGICSIMCAITVVVGSSWAAWSGSKTRERLAS